MNQQKELTGTKFNYGCRLYEADKWIVDLVEKINNKIDKRFHEALFSKVCFDILDIDDDTREAYCILEFNTRTGEDEEDAINTVKEVLDNAENVTYVFDDYPNGDEYGTSYDYPVHVTLK